MTTASSPQPIQQINVRDFAQRFAEGTEALQLIDVREPEEVAIAHLEGFKVLPLSQYQQWAESITIRFDPQRETFVLCHHGVRSAQMCQWLQLQGFSNVKNIVGGIHAYSQSVDDTIPQY
jgi:rhodanese-related sulfurtransferase